MKAINRLYHRFNDLRGRRLFILPTRFGSLYAGFLLLILLAAINYNNNLGHILCFLLASMGHLAVHYTYRNLAKIDLLNAYSEPCFLGQGIAFYCRFDNANQHDCYYLKIASKQSKARSWNPFKNITGFGYQDNSTIDTITSHQSTSQRIAVASTQRGRQSLGQIRLSTRYPVGLFNTWTYFTPECTALVYPKPADILPLPLTSSDGQHHRGFQHRGMDDFAGFKAYRAGDALHNVAWKAMARDDVLRTKQFRSNSAGKLLLSWQATASLGDIEVRLSQLCQWVLESESRGLDYGLELPKQTIEIGQGKAHQSRCLEALALYD